jgi:hypothetical protein
MFPIKIRWVFFATSLDASDAGNLLKGDFWMQRMESSIVQSLLISPQ